MDYPIRMSKIDEKAHMQRYASKYFAKKLKEHGFTSYQNEDLSWYKVVNGEVLLTVYIFTAFSMIPLLPFIGFGMHPLFTEAPIPQKVRIREMYSDEVMTIVCTDSPRCRISADIWVQATCSEECGAEKLDQEIFPVFDQIRSIEDVYTFYKSRYFRIAAANNGHINVTPAFIDMAVYLNDTEMYPYCQDRIERSQKLVTGRFWTKQDVERTELRYQAVVEGKRDMYLEELEKRKRKYMAKLAKKLGIKDVEKLCGGNGT